jgi:rod shape-determining protein MreD
VRRTLVLVAVGASALLLESTLLAQLRLGGVRPDVVVLAVVAVAMTCGPVTGASFGFGAGLVADLLFGGPAGLSAMVYTVVGFAVGTVRQYVTSPRAWVHLALAAAASLLAVWLAGLVLRVLDRSSWGVVARSGPLVAAYNLLLTPLVYPVVRFVAGRARPDWDAA